MSEASFKVELTITEVCERTQLPQDVLIEIVEEGILKPGGKTPTEWRFDSHMLGLCQRAVRLHHDLEIEWSGIPLFLDVIEQMHLLRAENRQLRRQLGRFLLDEDD